MTTDTKGVAGEDGSWFWDDVNCSIAHVKLCQRIKTRDPGNCPQINDRIPFVTVALEGSKKMLQAERIEHPDYILANNLKVDYLFYITNQIMNPCIQFFELITDRLSLIFNNIIKKETARNEQMFDKKAREAGFKKLEKYGIVPTDSIAENVSEWDPDTSFKTKSTLPVDDILINHKINQNTIARAKKNSKKTCKTVNYNKRKNKVIDLLVSDMNDKLETINSVNLDDLLSKLN